MPAPLAVDREQVRMLVVEHGVREAARRCNLNENTVLSWSDRGGWLDHLKPENQPKAPLSIRPTTAIGAIKPVDAQANLLMECRGKTRIGLAKWSATSAGHLETLQGEEALAAHQAAAGVATVMSKLWPESGPQSIRISMFAQSQVVDIEASPVDVDALPSCGTDVEQA